MIPIKDYIPQNEPCYYCHKAACDMFCVLGCAHGACFCPAAERSEAMMIPS